MDTNWYKMSTGWTYKGFKNRRNTAVITPVFKNQWRIINGKCIDIPVIDSYNVRYKSNCRFKRK